jgi:nucleoside-diphosphate-sugar epimerase
MSDLISGEATPIRTIVILGAGGYLGGALCRFFHALRSHRVIAVSRGEMQHRAFDMHVMADVFVDNWSSRIAAQGHVVLINCAFDFKAIGAGNEGKFAAFGRNIEALARSYATRLINISTMSAYAGCRTDYGREKLWVEGLFAKLGGINIRPGLIASWRFPGAAFQNLISITTGSKIIPVLVARGSGFYFCDLEAVVLGVYLLTIVHLNKPHTLSFCYRERLSLRATLQVIERRHHLRRVKVPVPWRFVYLALLVKEALIGKSKVRADSVLDFAHPVATPIGRSMFARMVGRFRSDLEALPGTTPAAGNFYFLEGPRDGSPVRPCRLKEAEGPDIMAPLGHFPDA